MRAVVLTRHGGPDALEYREDVPDPEPGPGEVRIRVRAEIARLVGGDEALAEHLFLLLEGAAARRGCEGTTAGLEAAREVACGLVSTNPGHSTD